VSSRANDFDASHRDLGNGRPRGYGAPGGATIDYDLGYGDEGFDTQGFRSPEVPDVLAGTPGFGGEDGTRGPSQDGTRGLGQDDTRGLGQLTREPPALRTSEPLLPDGPYRNLPLLPDGPGEKKK